MKDVVSSSDYFVVCNALGEQMGEVIGVVLQLAQNGQLYVADVDTGASIKRCFLKPTPDQLRDLASRIKLPRSLTIPR